MIRIFQLSDVLKDLMTDFRPMDADEYQAAIDKLELSQVAAARLLHIDPRTSRHYALGEYPVPPVIATLLRVMLRYKISATDLERLNRPKYMKQRS